MIPTTFFLWSQHVSSPLRPCVTCETRLTTHLLRNERLMVWNKPSNHQTFIYQQVCNNCQWVFIAFEYRYTYAWVPVRVLQARVLTLQTGWRHVPSSPAPLTPTSPWHRRCEPGSNPEQPFQSYDVRNLCLTKLYKIQFIISTDTTMVLLLVVLFISNQVLS